MGKYLFFFFSLFFLGTLQPLVARPWLKIQQVDSERFPQLHIDVLVADGEKTYMPFMGLDATHFKLKENDQEIKNFSLQTIDAQKENEMIVVLVDASRSLSKEEFNIQVQAILKFVDQVTPGDRLGVISFHDKYRLHCGFTSSKLQIRECVQKIKQGGSNTVLYDAINEGLRLLSTVDNKRPALLVFTDGRDEHSQFSFEDVLSQMKDSQIPIFTIATGQAQSLTQMKTLSLQSGGEIFYANNKKSIEEIYTTLPKMLDNMYRISYTSLQNKNITQKNVRIELQLVHTDVKDKDSAVFTVPALMANGWKSKFSWLSFSWLENFSLAMLLLMSAIFLIVLLILLLLIVLLRKKKTQIRLEVPSQYIHNAPSVDSQQDVMKDWETEDFLVKSIRHDQSQKPIKHYTKEEIYKLEQEKASVNHPVYLVEKQGPHTGKKYSILWQNVTIGQGLENSIVISDSSVSLRHAQIRQNEHYFVLYDLLSDGGTFLNGKKLLRPRILKDFDEIQVGRTALIFRQK